MKENREELDRLLEEMAEETPEMPADFHACWTKQIQEEQKTHKHSERTRQTRYILSAAALFVFLVGGTLITREWNRRHPAVTAPAPQAQVMYSVDAAGSNALKADALQAAEEREEAAEADNGAPMGAAPAGNAMESAAESAEEEEILYEAAEAPDMMMAEAAESAAEEEVYGEAAEAPAMKEAAKDAAAKRAEEPAEAAAAAGTAETETAAVKETGKTEAAAKPAEALKEENGFISFMRDFARFSLKALGVLAVIAAVAAAIITGRRIIRRNNSQNNSKK